MEQMIRIMNMAIRYAFCTKVKDHSKMDSAVSPEDSCAHKMGRYAKWRNKKADSEKTLAVKNSYIVSLSP